MVNKGKVLQAISKATQPLVNGNRLRCFFAPQRGVLKGCKLIQKKNSNQH